MVRTSGSSHFCIAVGPLVREQVAHLNLPMNQPTPTSAGRIGGGVSPGAGTAARSPVAVAQGPVESGWLCLRPPRSAPTLG